MQIKPYFIRDRILRCGRDHCKVCTAGASSFVFCVLGKTLCGQVLDVNMVNEPKEHVAKLKGQKRKEKETASQILSYYVTSLGAVIQVSPARY